MPRSYSPVIDRPDLCARAERELGLRDARARFFEGAWMVSGRNGDGRWRLFHLADEGWQELTAPDEEYEQGRLM